MYEIATNMKPSAQTFAPLILEKFKKIDDVEINTICTPRTADIQNMDGTISINNISEKDVEDVKRDWKSFSERVMDHLNNDPVRFYSAIKMFLHNSKVHGRNSDSWLYTSFKYQGVHTKNRKGKKIAVQPTSIARRKTSNNEWAQKFNSWKKSRITVG